MEQSALVVGDVVKLVGWWRVGSIPAYAAMIGKVSYISPDNTRCRVGWTCGADINTRSVKTIEKLKR
jgi:hypothetical protein